MRKYQHISEEGIQYGFEEGLSIGRSLANIYRVGLDPMVPLQAHLLVLV